MRSLPAALVFLAASAHAQSFNIDLGGPGVPGPGYVGAVPTSGGEWQEIPLPGVGPYAAAHVMMMLGRYSRLVLDSWTRPKYARLVGRKSVSDRTSERRFRRYGRFAGLAFWLFVTRDWVSDDGRGPPDGPG